MNFKGLLAAALVALFTVGCAQQGGWGTKQTVGGLGGAALGGLLGSQFGSGTGKLALTAAGVLVGGLVGSEIGRSLDEVDRARMDQANRQATSVPIGQSINWNNPDSGNYGTVTPTQTYQTSSGTYCRNFEQTVTVNGRTEVGQGTACRNANGGWDIQQ